MELNNPVPDYQPPPDRGLDILYIDDTLLVLNKPSGLLSVPGRGSDKLDSLASRVQQLHPDALIVHRLDMETSGIIVMARNAVIHRQLSQLFALRRIEKRYRAVVDGQPEASFGEIELPLISDWPNRPRQKVDHINGKPSITQYKVLNYDVKDNSSRLELTPLTGRSHQIRVHLQSIGHAILGDRLYATHQISEKSPRLLLHATFLAFTHPVSSERVEIECKPPF